MRRTMNISKFLKNHWFLLISLVPVNFIAYGWWREFIQSGKVTDNRHNLVFSGDLAAGHIVVISIVALYLNVYLIKLIIQEINSREF